MELNFQKVKSFEKLARILYCVLGWGILKKRVGYSNNKGVLFFFSNFDTLRGCLFEGYKIYSQVKILFPRKYRKKCLVNCLIPGNLF